MNDETATNAFQVRAFGDTADSDTRTVIRIDSGADGLDALLTHMVHATSVAMDDRRDGEREQFAQTPIPSLGRHEVDEALEVLDGRGGGDSMTAALAVVASCGLAFEDGLRLAAAAAALNVSRHGLGTGRRDSIEDIAGHVAITIVRRDGAGSTSSETSLVELTKSELYGRAKQHDIAGRSSMSRRQLLDALQHTESTA